MLIKDKLNFLALNRTSVIVFFTSLEESLRISDMFETIKIRENAQKMKP